MNQSVINVEQGVIDSSDIARVHEDGLDPIQLAFLEEAHIDKIKSFLDDELPTRIKRFKLASVKP